MTRTSRATVLVLTAGLLILPLSACADEPGINQSDPIPTEKQAPEGGSWPEENPDEVFEKHQEMPADFPETFVIPDDAVIDDVGSRGYGTWYLVLRADSKESADALWTSIIEAGQFAVSDESETVEGGRVAELTSGALSVSAMTMPGDDGAVLVNYDITSTVA